ncbi:serine protease HtrA [Geosporobacter ferrireducens]|uniref:serine protease HtrA n=1 Tax=Geosporobacter ferrireducens TaxID=1424294 RepID=UPI0023570B08|nr:trypsin-like peptidase domain-containing protein [Geosporobacter ferrireducens]
MDFHNRDHQQSEFEKRIEEQGQISQRQEEQQSSAYYVNRPNPTYYYKQKRPPYFLMILLALISAMIGSVIGAYVAPNYLYGRYIPYPQAPGIQGAPQRVEIVTRGEELTVIPAVAKKALPSVVGITTVTLERDIFSRTRRGQGVGTGVIVDSRGYILTNSHVVNDGRSEEVMVLFYDGENLKADVLWNDPMLDLAVLKVAAQNLPVADLGDSDKLTVGEIAVAIGNPLGLTFERTVTAGIISGLERSIPLTQFESIEGLIQTDASINPGNSGGPLLNAEGAVIGINTAKIQTGEGLGFAIPINTARPIVDEFIERGEFTKVYLGIRGINVQQYIQSYGDQLGTKQGVYVHQVTPETPVARAGMQDGDVIVKIAGQKIDTMGQLVRQMYKYRPGDSVKIEIIRAGEPVTLDVLLEAAPRSE